MSRDRIHGTDRVSADNAARDHIKTILAETKADVKTFGPLVIARVIGVVAVAIGTLTEEVRALHGLLDQRLK